MLPKSLVKRVLEDLLDLKVISFISFDNLSNNFLIEFRFLLNLALGNSVPPIRKFNSSMVILISNFVSITTLEKVQGNLYLFRKNLLKDDFKSL